jgi:hypothetical protein
MLIVFEKDKMMEHKEPGDNLVVTEWHVVVMPGHTEAHMKPA